jgi:predicted SAM-dependent methyltransferase
MENGKIDTEVIVFADIKPNVEGLMLHIGSGDGKMKGYINVDKYNKSADAQWDAVSLPLNDNSVSIIQCHQTLEHFEYHKLPAIFTEWFRVLKSGGTVHLTTPDIVASCKFVVDNPTNKWYLARIFGNQSHDGQFHKWGFTQDELYNLFGFAGFAYTRVGRYLENGNEPCFYVVGTK